ncbi:MAG: alpha/beta hydrolase [Desulfofustis sp.]|nr:alpha/beta hydrolase [Desulfofustis sp.]
MNNTTPVLQQWLEQYNQKLAHWQAQGNTFTPAIVRESLATMTRTYVTDIPELSLVIDDSVDNGGHPVPVRIFHPDQYSSLEVAVFLHGGGHMAGSIEVYDPICRKIALSAQRIVVAVDYRLAPEHPYPIGIEDGAAVLDACEVMLDGLGFNYRPRIALVGDSAGGAMSATLAHKYHTDMKQKIDKLVLIYPSLDYSLRSPSTDLFGIGYLLEKDRIQWYFDHYFSNEQDRSEASPIDMEITDTFPETMVITAGFCPLRDEGIEYAKRLKKHAIATRHIDFKATVHAFLNLENLDPDICRSCYQELGTFLRSPDLG